MLQLDGALAPEKATWVRWIAKEFFGPDFEGAYRNPSSLDTKANG
jgi:hypothetical protein